MYKKTVLSNGITVLTDSLPFFSTVSIGIWWKTGGRYEDPLNSGISHFIEHMLFKGTTKRTALDIATQIDAMGGTLNAFTGKEYTCLYAKVLKKHTDKGLDILSDMFNNSLFDKEDIDRERHVITEEIKMSEDNPEEYIHDIFTASYFNNHPLGMSILGKEANIKQFTKQRLEDWFRRCYNPGIMIITATGRLDHDAFVRKIEGFFPFSGSTDSVRSPLEAPETTGGINLYKRDLEHVYVCIGTKGISQVDRNRYPLYALNTILGGSMSSRLFQEIREKRGLVYNIFSYVNCYHDTGTFCISTSTSKEHLHDVLNMIHDEIIRIKNEGVTKNEVMLARESIKGNLFISLESSDAKMGRLAKNEIYFGGHIPMKDTVGEIDRIRKHHVDEVGNIAFGMESDISITVLGDVEKKQLEGPWMN